MHPANDSRTLVFLNPRRFEKRSAQALLDSARQWYAVAIGVSRLTLC